MQSVRIRIERSLIKWLRTTFQKEERIEILKNQVEQLRTEIIEKQFALDYLTFKIENYDEVMLPNEINLNQSSKETIKI